MLLFLDGGNMNEQDIYKYLIGIDHNKYVLHGSGEKMSTVKPTQGHHYRSVPELNQHAVYGTLSIDIAMLYAIIRGKRWGWITTYPDPNDSFRVQLPKQKNGVRFSSGYLYILPKCSFVEVSPFILYSYNEVTPSKILKISPQGTIRILKQNGVKFITFTPEQ